MCGRYAAAADTADLIEAFDIDEDATGAPARSILASPQVPPAGSPDYNLAPTKQARVVVTRPPRPQSPPGSPPVRQLRLLTWGLVPSWRPDPKLAYRMINARAETLLDKPAWRHLVDTRRALVPASGWYEWQLRSLSGVGPAGGGGRGKQPFFLHRDDGVPLAFAGLYTWWRDPAVVDADDPMGWLASFTIITTTAAQTVERIHDRQPLIVEPADWQRWLDPLAGADAVRDLLAPDAAFGHRGSVAAYPVSAAVNGTANNGPQLLAPVDPATGDGTAASAGRERSGDRR